jgi:hypothetical protein
LGKEFEDIEFLIDGASPTESDEAVRRKRKKLQAKTDVARRSQGRRRVTVMAAMPSTYFETYLF